MIGAAALAAAGMFMGMQAKATNPTIWADVPDPSIVRVGSDFYMSSTTMHMSPGLPIMKSKDLVHWKTVSYAYATLGDNEALTLTNGKNAYGKGSWASSIRYHEGTFYVSTFSSTTGKTYIYTTKTPDKGPWQERSFSPSLHDHSLFFDDDGKIYLVYGGGQIHLVEVAPDLSGLVPGTDRVIIENASKAAGSAVGLPAEGSQLFKVNGHYYLCNITWPRGGMRTELVHRADRIDGPYEGRVMFQDQGVAQGGIVDTPDGKWYAYLFQDHGAVGRIPYLVPMTWEDGWPKVGVNGKLPMELDISAKGSPVDGIIGSDDFNGSELPLFWQWNHDPDPEGWSLRDRKGYLRLKPRRVDSTVIQARNTLTQRTFGPQCEATATFDLSGMKDGDRAGLIALQNQYAFIGVKVEGNSRSLVMASSDGKVEMTVAEVPWTSDKVELLVSGDFRDRRDEVTFRYRTPGGQWKSLGNAHRLHYDLVHFMGCRFGIFNYATKSTGGHVDVDRFHFGPPQTQ